MDPNIPKNEREWWAAGEITYLRVVLAHVVDLRAENERLRTGAEQDAKELGELQFLLHQLLLCEIDDEAEAMIRSALEPSSNQKDRERLNEAAAVRAIDRALQSLKEWTER